MMTDLYLLAHSDFVVCTFSSNVSFTLFLLPVYLLLNLILLLYLSDVLYFFFQLIAFDFFNLLPLIFTINLIYFLLESFFYFLSSPVFLYLLSYSTYLIVSNNLPTNLFLFTFYVLLPFAIFIPLLSFFFCLQRSLFNFLLCSTLYYFISSSTFCPCTFSYTLQFDVLEYFNHSWVTVNNFHTNYYQNCQAN